MDNRIDENGGGRRGDPRQSRGEAFDEAQGGGRDDRSVSSEGREEQDDEEGELETQKERGERDDFEREESETDAQT